MNWIFEDKPVNSLPGIYGFIYKLTLEKDDKTYYYIGKRQILEMKTLSELKSKEQRPNSERIRKKVMVNEDGYVIVSKADKAEARKRGIKATIQNFDRLMVESKWQKYESSSEDIKDYTIVKKEIIELVPDAKLSNKWLTYLENYWLYKEEVLMRSEYLNSNISGAFFKADFPQEK